MEMSTTCQILLILVLGAGVTDCWEVGGRPVRRVAVWRTRAFLCVPRSDDEDAEAPATLLEAVWPEKGSIPSSYPNFDMQEVGNCFAFQSVVALDVEVPRARLWVLDAGGHGCEPKLVIFDLNTNKELLHIELTDTPGKWLSSLVVDSTGPLAPRAYIGDSGRGGLLVYSLRDRRWWQLDLKDAGTPVIAWDLALSRREPLLYITSPDTEMMFGLNLINLRRNHAPPVYDSRPVSETASVQVLGRKLGLSAGLAMDHRSGLHYFLLRDSSVVRWDTRRPLSPEAHSVAFHSTELLPVTAHLFVCPHRQVWAVVSTENKHPLPADLEDDIILSRNIRHIYDTVYERTYYTSDKLDTTHDTPATESLSNCLQETLREYYQEEGTSEHPAKSNVFGTNGDRVSEETEEITNVAETQDNVFAMTERELFTPLGLEKHDHVACYSDGEKYQTSSDLCTFVEETERITDDIDQLGTMYDTSTTETLLTLQSLFWSSSRQREDEEIVNQTKSSNFTNKILHKTVQDKSVKAESGEQLGYNNSGEIYDDGNTFVVFENSQQTNQNEKVDEYNDIFEKNAGIMNDFISSPNENKTEGSDRFLLNQSELTTHRSYLSQNIPTELYLRMIPESPLLHDTDEIPSVIRINRESALNNSGEMLKNINGEIQLFESNPNDEDTDFESIMIDQGGIHSMLEESFDTPVATDNINISPEYFQELSNQDGKYFDGEVQEKMPFSALGSTELPSDVLFTNIDIPTLSSFPTFSKEDVKTIKEYKGESVHPNILLPGPRSIEQIQKLRVPQISNEQLTENVSDNSFTFDEPVEQIPSTSVNSLYKESSHFIDVNNASTELFPSDETSEIPFSEDGEYNTTSVPSHDLVGDTNTDNMISISSDNSIYFPSDEEASCKHRLDEGAYCSDSPSDASHLTGKELAEILIPSSPCETDFPYVILDEYPDKELRGINRLPDDDIDILHLIPDYSAERTQDTARDPREMSNIISNVQNNGTIESPSSDESSRSEDDTQENNGTSNLHSKKRTDYDQVNLSRSIELEPANANFNEGIPYSSASYEATTSVDDHISTSALFYNKITTDTHSMDEPATEGTLHDNVEYTVTEITEDESSTRITSHSVTICELVSNSMKDESVISHCTLTGGTTFSTERADQQQVNNINTEKSNYNEYLITDEHEEESVTRVTPPSTNNFQSATVSTIKLISQNDARISSDSMEAESEIHSQKYISITQAYSDSELDKNSVNDILLGPNDLQPVIRSFRALPKQYSTTVNTAFGSAKPQTGSIEMSSENGVEAIHEEESVTKVRPPSTNNFQSATVSTLKLISSQNDDHISSGSTEAESEIHSQKYVSITEAYSDSELDKNSVNDILLGPNDLQPVIRSFRALPKQYTTAVNTAFGSAKPKIGSIDISSENGVETVHIPFYSEIDEKPDLLRATNADGTEIYRAPPNTEIKSQLPDIAVPRKESVEERPVDNNIVSNAYSDATENKLHMDVDVQEHSEPSYRTQPLCTKYVSNERDVNCIEQCLFCGSIPSEEWSNQQEKSSLAHSERLSRGTEEGRQGEVKINLGDIGINNVKYFSSRKPTFLIDLGDEDIPGNDDHNYAPVRLVCSRKGTLPATEVESHAVVSRSQNSPGKRENLNSNTYQDKGNSDIYLGIEPDDSAVDFKSTDRQDTNIFRRGKPISVRGSPEEQPANELYFSRKSGEPLRIGSLGSYSREGGKKTSKTDDGSWSGVLLDSILGIASNIAKSFIPTKEKSKLPRVSSGRTMNRGTSNFVSKPAVSRGTKPKGRDDVVSLVAQCYGEECHAMVLLDKNKAQNVKESPLRSPYSSNSAEKSVITTRKRGENSAIYNYADRSRPKNPLVFSAGGTPVRFTVKLADADRVVLPNEDMNNLVLYIDSNEDSHSAEGLFDKKGITNPDRTLNGDVLSGLNRLSRGLQTSDSDILIGPSVTSDAQSLYSAHASDMPNSSLANEAHLRFSVDEDAESSEDALSDSVGMSYGAHPLSTSFNSSDLEEHTTLITNSAEDVEVSESRKNGSVNIYYDNVSSQYVASSSDTDKRNFSNSPFKGLAGEITERAGDRQVPEIPNKESVEIFSENIKPSYVSHPAGAERVDKIAGTAVEMEVPELLNQDSMEILSGNVKASYVSHPANVDEQNLSNSIFKEHASKITDTAAEMETPELLNQDSMDILSDNIKTSYVSHPAGIDEQNLSDSPFKEHAETDTAVEMQAPELLNEDGMEIFSDNIKTWYVDSQPRAEEHDFIHSSFSALNEQSVMISEVSVDSEVLESRAKGSVEIFTDAATKSSNELASGTAKYSSSSKLSSFTAPITESAMFLDVANPSTSKSGSRYGTSFEGATSDAKIGEYLSSDFAKPSNDSQVPKTLGTLVPIVNINGISSKNHSTSTSTDSGQDIRENMASLVYNQTDRPFMIWTANMANTLSYFDKLMTISSKEHIMSTEATVGENEGVTPSGESIEQLDVLGVRETNNKLMASTGNLMDKPGSDSIIQFQNMKNIYPGNMRGSHSENITDPSLKLGRALLNNSTTQMQSPPSLKDAHDDNLNKEAHEISLPDTKREGRELSKGGIEIWSNRIMDVNVIHTPSAGLSEGNILASTTTSTTTEDSVKGEDANRQNILIKINANAQPYVKIPKNEYNPSTLIRVSDPSRRHSGYTRETRQNKRKGLIPKAFQFISLSSNLKTWTVHCVLIQRYPPHIP